ncbi:MAG: amidohydrolase family protein [Acidobacteriota bacterium]|nr:amidohydrolase family protein [Acidobacteriota bacterium]
MKYVKTRLALVAALVSLALFSVIYGQTTAPSVTLIRAGRLFDSERGIFLPARDILVKGNTIEAVGENLPLPKGARVVDLTRYAVMPGLIDAHTHLLYLEDPRGGLTTEGVKALTMEGTPLRALRGAARARTFLLAGITTVRDLGNAGRFGDVALRTAINDGSLDGPRMYASGPGLSPEGGQFPGLQFKYRGIAEEEYRIVRGAEDARLAVRENVTYGANVIKIYSNASPNPALLSLEEMRAIVAEARLLGVKVAAHATSDLAISRAVEAGVDSIEHGYQAEDTTLMLMKERGVALVPTYLDSVNLKRLYAIAQPTRPPTEQELSAALKQRYERIQRAMKVGVTIVAGSDN